MEKVFRLGDFERVKIPSSGSTQWLLARTDHLSVYILENRSGAEFVGSGHPGEELVYVLQGQIEYEDGRVVNAREAVFNLPNIPCRGRYVGIEPIQLLKIRVRPWPESSTPSTDLMKKVIKLKDIEPSKRPTSGSLQRIVVLTENVSVCCLENRPVRELPEPGHPEEEIIYVLQGQIEYENGRLVGAGEALCNLPDLPHPARYVGTEPIRIIEIKSPPDHRLSVK